jgi:hypothetical protein
MGSVAVGGCVDDAGPAFFISGNLAPDDTCVVTTGSPVLAAGTYNVARHARGYLFSPLYNNQLFPNSSTAPPRPDPNGLIVEGGEVEIRDAAGNPISFPGLPNPFSVTSATFVPSSSGPGGTPGQAVGALEIIPNAYADELDLILGDPNATLRILVSIIPFGETTGHVSLDGLEYIWPIDICSGDCGFVVPGPDESLTCCYPGQDFICPETTTTP